jgi:hypothetical protein
MPVTSKPFRGITFSLLLTKLGVRVEGADRKEEERTIKASYYRLAIVPLPDHNLDMRVFTGQLLEVVLEVGSRICR